MACAPALDPPEVHPVTISFFLFGLYLNNSHWCKFLQALISGKKPAVVERMVLGRFRRYFEETVLLDQKFVINDYINVQVTSHVFI